MVGVVRRPFAIVALLFVALLSSARADDGNWSTFGSAGAFTRNSHVRMEREDVRITLDDSEVRVHATFWFRNHGAARTVRMGFPDEARRWPDRKDGVITAFRSNVDGQPVKVTRTVLAAKDPELYKAAWVKSVRFARNGTRKVEVWYTADHGIAGNGWAFDTYVFRTGATWRGTIGRIETTVDWTRIRERSRPMLELTGPAPGARWTRLGHRKYRLVVENVRPKFDLDLTTIEGFWHFRLNGRRLEQNLGLPVDEVGAMTTGTPEDLRVPVEGLGRIFGRYLENAGGNTDWAAPEARRVGRKLELVGRQTLVTGDGRRLRLARPATTANGRPLTGKEDEAAYVRLRDVFRALGGRYVYIPREERVDLTLP